MIIKPTYVMSSPPHTHKRQVGAPTSSSSKPSPFRIGRRIGIHATARKGSPPDAPEVTDGNNLDADNTTSIMAQMQAELFSHALHRKHVDLAERMSSRSVAASAGEASLSTAAIQSHQAMERKKSRQLLRDELDIHQHATISPKSPLSKDRANMNCLFELILSISEWCSYSRVKSHHEADSEEVSISSETLSDDGSSTDYYDSDELSDSIPDTTTI